MNNPERRLSQRDTRGVSGPVVSDLDRNVATRRLKKGECPTCGNKTHKVNFFGKRTALTIEGQCLYGRCLLCNPVEGYSQRPAAEPSLVPQTIDADRYFEIPDDSTMVSNITMDHRLIIGARNWDGQIPEDELSAFDDNSFDSDDMAPGKRPDASVGGDSFRPQRPLGRDGSILPGSAADPIGPPKRYASSHDHHMNKVGTEIGVEINDLAIHGRRSWSKVKQRPPSIMESAPYDRHDARTESSFPTELSQGPRHQRQEGQEWTSVGEPVAVGIPSPNAQGLVDTAVPGSVGGHRIEEEPAERDDIPKDFDIRSGVSYNGSQSTQEMNNRQNYSGNASRGSSERDRSNRSDTMQPPMMFDTPEFTTSEVPTLVESYDSRPPQDALSAASYPELKRKPSNALSPADLGRNPSNAVLPPDLGRNSSNAFGLPDLARDSTNVFNNPPELGRNATKILPTPPEQNEPSGYDLNFGFTHHSNGSGGYRDSKPPSSPRSLTPPRPRELETPWEQSSPRGRRGLPDDDYGRDSAKSPRQSGNRDVIRVTGIENSVAVARFNANQSDSAATPKSAASNIMLASVPPAAASMPDLPSSSTESRSVGRPSDRGPITSSRGARGRRRLPARPATGKSHPDVSTILNNMDDSSDRGKAFNQLSDIVLGDGQKAKTRFKEFYGMETLVESMWEDMGNADVQAAACGLVYSLAASRDASATNDAMVGANAEGAVDALLFVMQTHRDDERIQRAGIGALYCLAGSSANNPEINDGSLSGAVLSVVNAMEAHPTAASIQEMGIRALFCQCVQSTNSESNKSTLAKTKIDSGVLGIDVLPKAAETVLLDMVTSEWVCRLYWCLSTSEEIAGIMSKSSAHQLAVLRSLRTHFNEPCSFPLVEAAFGSLANFARLEQNHATMLEEGVVGTVIEAMQKYEDKQGIIIEACALLANLSQTMAMKNEIVESDGVETISRCMVQHSGSSEVLEESICALCAVAIGSKMAKATLSRDALFNTVVHILGDLNASSAVHEKVCALIASICTLKEAAELAVSCGVLDSLLSTMKARLNERKFLEAATMALRNIVCHGAGLDAVGGLDFFQLFVQVMEFCAESEMVQVNACTALWNISERISEEPRSIVDAGGIEQIVKAMQSHMESADVLETACGALWSLTCASEERKQAVVGSGGIDAITCSLVMHPKDSQTLEMALGVLSCITVKASAAGAVAESQGISMVVDAMRGNNRCIPLLELGILVLRNIVLSDPRFASEASNGISTIINAMKDHPDSISIQKESCNALWAMAAESEDCKSKILALDGVTILMEALDHNSNVGDVEDAARGAINQLAMSGQGGM